jgi:hypothetical protein
MKRFDFNEYDYESRDNDPALRRASRRQNIKDFFKGFFVALAVLVPSFALAVYFHGQQRLPDDITAQDVVQPAPSVPVSSVPSYNLLHILSDETTGNLLSVTLLRFDTQRYRIYTTVLPHTTVLLQQRTPVPLFTLYEQRGALAIKTAIEETLSIPVDGYLAMTTQQLTYAVDLLGEFSFTLDAELRVAGQNDLTLYSKQPGTSPFSGNDVAKLLVHGAYIDDPLLNMQERLWQSALEEYTDDTFAEALTDLYGRIINQVKTDIGAGDLPALTRAISVVCPETGAQIDIVRARGAFIDYRYELSEGCDETLWTYYTKLTELNDTP